jgi:transcriptional regulator with XRE-family HTH domain
MDMTGLIDFQVDGEEGRISDPAAFALENSEMAEASQDAPKDDPTFGQVLKELRTKRGITIVELANLLRRPVAQIALWERHGARKPGLDPALEIAESLALSEQERGKLFRTLVDPRIRDSLQSQAAAVTEDTEEYVRSLVTHFDFPEEVRVACTQYLVYFTRFLKEAGIEATSDVLQKAGQTLFTVSPSDDTVALSKIREALDIYLQVPVRADVNLPTAYGADPAELGLASQVFHLKSQLTLAIAEIQSREAQLRAAEEIVRAKEEVIYTQRLVLHKLDELATGEVLIKSVTGSVREVMEHYEEKDEEALLGNAVKVGEIEQWGVKVSLAEILRGVKQLFKD